MIHNIQKSANETHFDKNISGLNSNNVQGAIDEVVNTIGYTMSKNLLKLGGNTGDTQTYVGITVKKTGNSTYTLSGTSTQDTWFEIGYRFSIGTSEQTNNYLELDVNKTYCASVRVEGTISNTSGKNPSITFNESTVAIVRLTDTLNTSMLNNTSGIKRVYITIPNGTTFNNVTLKLQLEEGTEVTSFESHVYDVQTQINNIKTTEYKNVIIDGTYSASTSSQTINIPNYMDYNMLSIRLQGDNNNGIRINIPRVLYGSPTPFYIDTKNKNDSGYSFKAQGSFVNGSLVIYYSTITGWSKFNVFVVGIS